MGGLELESLTFRHASAPDYLFRDLSLAVPRGQSLLITGENGAGKTTLGHLACGVLRSESGRILIDGSPIDSTPRKRVRQAVFFAQVTYLLMLRHSLEAELQMLCRLVGRQRADFAEVERQYTLPADLSVVPLDLSLPDMWRFMLFALGEVMSPSLLFIDEIVAPSTQVNRVALEALIAGRRARNQTTILAYQRSVEGSFDVRVKLEKGGFTRE